MFVIEAFSKKCTHRIGELLPDKTELELEHINYGINILLINLIKMPIILIIAALLGILNYTIVAFISFGLVRSLASGVHIKNGTLCFLTTGITFLGIGFVGSKVNLRLADISIAFISCLILAYLYAPADTEERPLVSSKLRNKLKDLTYFSIVFLFIAALVLKGTIYANVITFSVLTECITLLPITYKIFKRRYNNYEVLNSQNRSIV